MVRPKRREDDLAPEDARRREVPFGVSLRMDGEMKIILRKLSWWVKFLAPQFHWNGKLRPGADYGWRLVGVSTGRVFIGLLVEVEE